MIRLVLRTALQLLKDVSVTVEVLTGSSGVCEHGGDVLNKRGDDVRILI